MLDFAAALWVLGIQADIDLWHLSEQEIEWTRWGPGRIRACARTLVVVNAAWRTRFDGENGRTEGAGARAEADALMGLFERDQADFRRRVVLVVLPGASEDDIPDRLRGFQRRVLADLTSSGMDSLVRLLTGQPAYVPPPLGSVPLLPPHTLKRIETDAAAATQTVHMEGMAGTARFGTVTDTADVEPMPPTEPAQSRQLRALDAVPASGGFEGAAAALTATSSMGADAAVRSAPAAALTATSSMGAEAEQRSRLRGDVALVQAARRAAAALPRTPSPASRDEPTSELRRLEELSARLEAVQVALAEQDHRHAALTTADTPSASVATPAAFSRDEIDQQLTALLDQVQAGLETADACWLVLAAVLHPPRVPSWAAEEPAAIRARREQTIEAWAQSVPVPANNPVPGRRAPGRVVFAGTAPTASTVQEASPRSQVWRLEVDDAACAVAAGAVSGEVQLGPATGTWYRSSTKAHEPEVGLPVRQEMLELWLVSQLQVLAVLLADGQNTAATAGSETSADAVVHLRATLLSPPQLSHPQAHHPQGQQLRLVTEHRDADGHRDEDMPVPCSRSVATGTPIATNTVDIALAELATPTALVATARHLALRLVEHFGAEATIVLRPPPHVRASTDAHADADGGTHGAGRAGGELPVDALRAPEALQQRVHQYARDLGLPVDPEDLSPAARRTRAEELVAQARTLLRQ